ncbi:hypothetical protein [uncultured Cohaesibacter sp.]|uniref:hypothetical protein n=1 Tax=uncultured Cohaesibacter sp. TaxID=1002546 RepID=UPI00292F65D1|nr:hypothetical protein [uncultured Cohaesibacter sp.]
MQDDLAHCKKEIRRIRSEIRQFETEKDRVSGRMLLLEAKKSLKDLITHMREQQHHIKGQRSRSTKANHAASAYSQLNQFRKYDKR